ncbi:unnamed protein product [Gulo gulo]|uniref:Uncharacterized protein n=1 Tax=Gulo gulo TaxID=48420 RepID=A0A9X9M7Z7_GULGU|nr:unnamed protein product [Gulo gulo]
MAYSHCSQVSVHSFSKFSLCYYSDTGSGPHRLSSFHQNEIKRGNHSSRRLRTLALSTLRGPFVALKVCLQGFFVLFCFKPGYQQTYQNRERCPVLPCLCVRPSPKPPAASCPQISSGF